MGKSGFELLVKYNTETNIKMNKIISTLSEDEWNKQCGGYFKSIHELCSHIFFADYTWLKRFKSFNIFKSLKDEYFNKDYDYKDVLFRDVTEYTDKRTELDSIIANFCKELTIDDLDREMKWDNNRTGESLQKTIRVCLSHVFNHETHHRGMISLYLELLGKENDFSNLHVYG